MAYLDLSCLDPFGLDQVLEVVPCQAWAGLQEAHLVAIAAQVDLGDLGDLQDLEVWVPSYEDHEVPSYVGIVHLVVLDLQEDQDLSIQASLDHLGVSFLVSFQALVPWDWLLMALVQLQAAAVVVVGLVAVALVQLAWVAVVVVVQLAWVAVVQGQLVLAVVVLGQLTWAAVVLGQLAWVVAVQGQLVCVVVVQGQAA